ncbi:hypothetical protein [Actinoplanes subglobosus]|uniref:Uncharacterized protein n=1 Tax=Actinoplanes subglobosus TaxID=1547892 RepID=A0ABV8J1M6_9ACTN
MQRATWLPVVFLTAAGLQVATIYYDHPVVPYSGTLAMVALLALACSAPKRASVRPWSRRAALTGLTLLTAVALLADGREDGYGWPMAVADDSDTVALLTEVLLSTAGAGALALAVLGRATRLFQRRNLPGVVAGLAVLATAAYIAKHPETPYDGMIPADIGLRLNVLMPVAAVGAALCLAANAAWTSAAALRPAAAGLLAAGVLSWAGFTGLSENDALQAQWPPGPQIRTEPYTGPLWSDVSALTVSPGLSRADVLSLIGNAPPPPPAEEDWWQAALTDWEADIRHNENPLLSFEGYHDPRDSAAALEATVIAVGLAFLVLALFPPRRPGPYLRGSGWTTWGWTA